MANIDVTYSFDNYVYCVIMNTTSNYRTLSDSYHYDLIYVDPHYDPDICVGGQGSAYPHFLLFPGLFLLSA